MTVPADRTRYALIRRVIAFLAGLACAVIGFVIVVAVRLRIADPLVGWGLVSAGFGLMALAVPL